MCGRSSLPPVTKKDLDDDGKGFWDAMSTALTLYMALPALGGWLGWGEPPCCLRKMCSTLEAIRVHEHITYTSVQVATAC